MKIIHRYIFKELAKPFFSSLLILIFVLLSNFVLKNIDKFLGKGISISVVIKFILLNSAWIFSLAVPMAILITTLVAFGRLSSDNEIVALKASGITYFDIIKPGIIFGTIIIIFMIPFNLWLLPEMNHNIKKTSYEISRNRPDVDFNEHMLNTLSNKVIYLGKRLSENSFNDVIIFDNANVNNHVTILADNGKFSSLNDGIILDLNSGSIHENTLKNNEYRKTYFQNYKITIPFDELNMNSNVNLNKQEREMNIALLINKINFYKQKIKTLEKKIINNSVLLDSLNKKMLLLSKTNMQDLLSSKRIKNRINSVIAEQNKNQKLIPYNKKEINKHSVEVHKKFTIPIACLFFILLGTPLGIMTKKGNLGINIGLSILIFIIYWAFLIVGENLSDNNRLNAGIAMWMPNLFIGIISYYLYKIYTKENYSFNIDLSIFKRK